MYQPPVLLNSDDRLDVDIDLSVLTNFEDAQFDDEPDLIVELIDIYLKDTPMQIAVMREALAKTDETSLGRAAHTLKGSSSSLGVKGVAAICEEIEQISGAELFQTIDPLLCRLEQKFERVRHVFVAEKERRLS